MEQRVGRSWWMIVARSATLALVLVLVASFGCRDTGLDADAVTTNNRGVAMMGRFDYTAARAEFAKVLERYPGHPDVLVNLAIATLNEQGEGDEKKALEIINGVLERQPHHQRALYCQGLLELHQGNPEAALASFKRVNELDPHDPDTAYFIGQSLMQMSELEQAFSWYQKAIEADPYLRSAYYAVFQCLQRLRRIDEAKEALATFKRLEDNPRVRLVEFKYTKMGAKGDVLALGAAQPNIPDAPSGPLFDPPRTLVPAQAGSAAAGDESGRAKSITVCDINHDGALDLFVAGAAAAAPDSDPGNLVLLADSEGGYQVAEHPLASVTGVNAALWGDIDNDGRNDVYLCRRGANQLWQQTADGEWQDLTETTGTANGTYNTVDGALFDADHDGDLDIFTVNLDGPNELLNNNRDGSFRPLAADYGLAGSGQGSRSVLLADLDNDRDADIIVINKQPPHQVYENRLLWEYHPATGWDAFLAADIAAAAAADRDADGRMEIYTLDSSGKLQSWYAGSDGVWSPGGSLRAATTVGTGVSSVPRLALADLDGDGMLDIVASGPDHLTVLISGPSDGPFSIGSPPRTLTGWTLAAGDPVRGPSLVGWVPEHGLQQWPPGPGRHQLVSIRLSGKEDSAQSIRSNASGIGTRVAVRTGSSWAVLTTFRQGSGPGQSLQPLQIGLGTADRIDFVTIDWTDGVYQTELDLAPGAVVDINETQRQLSSCPVLFAFDGERYRFISDLLGVGGIGYALGPPGEYSEPRPWEVFLLPEGVPGARDGRILLKLGEPMEEALYLDTARLVAYDLPPGWSMTIDERMGIAGPQPTGQALFYRNAVLPQRAVNDRGDVVTETVLAADHRAAPVGRLDHRFIGLLEEEHVLTLRFAEPLDGRTGEPVLIADGWVEYPYSQTNFAAWQAGAAYLAPTLSALAGNGRWQVLLEQLGYPAGMPRQMSLPLPELPTGTRELRLSTNQEVYWDRLAVAYAEPCPQAERRDLALVDAELRVSGFPLRSTGAQRLPGYRYETRSPVWDTRVQAGWYTRIGPVLELVADGDDAVAIIGPGEEIHLQFSAPEGSPPAGWTRRYVLEVEGWCKDMDLYTRDGDTLEPLPRSGRGGAERERLHAEYNTRYRAGQQ